MCMYVCVCVCACMCVCVCVFTCDLQTLSPLLSLSFCLHIDLLFLGQSFSSRPSPTPSLSLYPSIELSFPPLSLSPALPPLSPLLLPPPPCIDLIFCGQHSSSVSPRSSYRFPFILLPLFSPLLPLFSPPSPPSPLLPSPLSWDPSPLKGQTHTCTIHTHPCIHTIKPHRCFCVFILSVCEIGRAHV